MESVKLFILILFSTISYIISLQERPKDPTLMICILVRNKAHTLPYFLSYLENLNYPKDRISLWIRSDHNEDKSDEVLDTWLNQTASAYHSVNLRSGEKSLSDDTNPFEWTNERYKHIIKLKEEALEQARRMLADYIFFLDADVFLTDAMTLKKLIKLNLPIVAPMLISQSLYSNFWGGMRENYYYRRTEEYMHITKYKKVGEYKVPLVNSATLIDLNHINSKYLTHDKQTLINQNISSSESYDGPLDDTIVLAMSAQYSSTPIYISNSHRYGYIMAPENSSSTFEEEWNQIQNVHVMLIRDYKRIPLNSLFSKYIRKPVKTTLGLSKIFVISLERRRERFEHIRQMTEAIGLEIEHFPAIDGNTITTETLYRQGYRILKGYNNSDEQPMKMGEIGCFLSHFKLWEKVLDQNSNINEALILEDDISFEHYFKLIAESAINEARTLLKKFDLIYFGRHQPKGFDDGDMVKGSKYLRQAGLSQSARAYILTKSGAKKLIAEKPLQKMIPVDEYLSVMYDKYPNKTIKSNFSRRDLKSFAVVPNIVHPLFARGQREFISDTENSREIENIQMIYSDVLFKDEL